MPVEPTRAQRRLADRLAALAQRHRVTGKQLAAALGVSTSTLSRTWNGDRLPSDVEVAQWLDLVHATPDERADVAALLDAAVNAGRRWTDEDSVALQDDATELVRASRLVWSYDQTIVPGWLQAPGYARRVIERAPGVTDVDAHVAARMRAAAATYESGRSWVFVIAAHVLERDLGDPAALAAQRAQLASVAQLEHVELLVLDDTPTALIGPMAPFTLYERAGDRPVVHVELPHGLLSLQDPDDVQAYREVFAQVREAAHPLPV